MKNSVSMPTKNQFRKWLKRRGGKEAYPESIRNCFFSQYFREKGLDNFYLQEISDKPSITINSKFGIIQSIPDVEGISRNMVISEFPTWANKFQAITSFMVNDDSDVRMRASVAVKVLDVL